jgi:hypothetical protein
MPIQLDSAKTLFVHIHWMKYYDGRPDEAFRGGQSSDGWMENYNFLDYGGAVFGGFWPGRYRRSDDHAKELNLDRLSACGESNAKHITVLFFAPHPKDNHLRLIGWYNDATVFRRIQEHPDDDQSYNITARYENAHRIAHHKRERVFDFTGWWKQGGYRFGDNAPPQILKAVQAEIRMQSRR